MNGSTQSNLEKDKCKNFLSSIELIFADECHRTPANSNYLVMNACPAYFRFGLSGTPLKRSDGADLRLIASTGPVIYTMGNKELIRRGISNPVEIHMLRIRLPYIDPKTPYPHVYKLGISEKSELFSVFRAWPRVSK